MNTSIYGSKNFRKKSFTGFTKKEGERTTTVWSEYAVRLADGPLKGSVDEASSGPPVVLL